MFTHPNEVLLRLLPNSSMDEMFVYCMNELIVNLPHATIQNYAVVLHRVLSIITSDLQFITSKRAISIRYKLILNIISIKYFCGY